VETARFQEAMAASPSVTQRMLRYSHAYSVQIASTAFANAEHTLEMRLARWLLMCHDRADGDEFAITHEFLSIMLGVRRAGVTTALHVLEGAQAIRSKRGYVRVLAREKLDDLADGYGMAEREYERVFGIAGYRAGKTNLLQLRPGSHH
jgi:CRP-like cAMP-binding protein